MNTPVHLPGRTDKSQLRPGNSAKEVLDKNAWAQYLTNAALQLPEQNWLAFGWLMDWTEKLTAVCTHLCRHALRALLKLCPSTPAEKPVLNLGY